MRAPIYNVPQLYSALFETVAHEGVVQTKTPLSTDTVDEIARQLVDLRIDARHVEGVAELLNALSADMQAMQAMDVGSEEPAVTYRAVEP